MKIIFAIMQLLKSIQVGLEYSENLLFIQIKHSLIQEMNIKPKKLGFQVTKEGILPTKSITKDGFINLFELYELSPDEIEALYGHIIVYKSGSEYHIQGFKTMVTPVVLNILFLSNFEFLKYSKSLVVTKRDYLNSNEDIFDSFQAICPNLKYAVPESLAYTAFLAYERKSSRQNVITINTKGKMTVLSLNKVETKNLDGKDKICIKNLKCEMYEDFSDGCIKSVMKSYIKDEIIKAAAKENLFASKDKNSKADESAGISFLPGKLNQNLYCDLDTIYRDVLKKLKTGSLTYRADWIDLYRVKGDNTVLEGIEFNFEGVITQIKNLILSKKTGLKDLLNKFLVDVKDFDLVFLTDLNFSELYNLLDIQETIKVNNSESGIAKGAFYLNYDIFSLDHKGITSTKTKKKIGFDHLNKYNEILDEIKVYKRLRKILEEIGDNKIRSILDLCPDNVVDRLQSIFDRKEWDYRNSIDFCNEYTGQKLRNKSIKKEESFRDEYIKSLEEKLSECSDLIHQKDLWNLIKNEYEVINEWFKSNKNNSSLRSFEFREKYDQISDSINFFKHKLQEEKLKIKEDLDKKDAEKKEDNAPKKTQGNDQINNGYEDDVRDLDKNATVDDGAAPSAQEAANQESLAGKKIPLDNKAYQNPEEL